MEWIADPTAWLGLLTLIILELVLGIDNLVFIAILADKLPPHQRDKARIIGLTLALVMRLALLSGISWMVTLINPLVTVFGHEFTGRDLIMFFGGIFLLFKATMELHERLEGHTTQKKTNLGYALFWPIVLQIVVLDAVFSLDAVITAVGMVDELAVMMIAVIFSMIIMLIASKPLTTFVNAHPTVIMLCLGFLMMIGFSLTADGLGFKIPKGYLYAAIGFSIVIELFNHIARKRRKKSLQGEHSVRVRTAHAVLRLIGARKLEQDEVSDEIVDLVANDDQKPVFDRQERVMISGVLTLAERTLRAIMTPAHEIDHVDMSLSQDEIKKTLVNSPYSRLPVTRNGLVSEAKEFIQKKDMLRAFLENKSMDIPELDCTAIRLPIHLSILNALERMREDSTHIAFVVNDHDEVVGLVTVTNILESIAGALPDSSEAEEALNRPRLNPQM